MYIRKWIERAQIDYFSMFTNAWIPFNAWYMEHYADESLNRTSDRKIIDYLCKNENHITARIISLLRNRDSESMLFRQYMANIQKELLSHPMPSVTNQLTLDTVNLEQYYTTDISKLGRYRIYDIKCSYTRSQPKGTKRIKCEAIIRKTSHTKYLVEQLEWNRAEFVTISDYTAIPSEMLRQAIIDVYDQINPKYPTKITKLPIIKGAIVKAPMKSIKLGEIDTIYVDNDTNKVAATLLNLLYELRCKLLHGEIDPIESYQPIYRYAYEIQMMLNKELLS